MKNLKTKIISFRVSPELMTKIQEDMKKTRRQTVSDYVVFCIQNQIDKK